MKLPPYPLYRPSGVEWIGDVPEHWASGRVNGLFRLRSGGTPNTDTVDYWDGDVPWVSAKDMKSIRIIDAEDHITSRAVLESATSIVPRGTVLIVARSGILKHTLPVAVIEIPVAINQDIKGLLPQVGRIDGLFFAYWIQGHQSLLLTLWRQQGATVESLDIERMKIARVPLPPLPEQRAIAYFLDRETAQIDTLVVKKRSLIDRLKEKRTALISRTVTRGLPPDAARAAGLDSHPKLKPSGIDWLGDVPESWRILPFKRFCSRVDVGIAEAATHAYCDDGVPLIRSTNIRPNVLDTTDLLRIEPWFAEKNRSKTLRAGDLVTVRTGYPGTTAVIPSELEGSQCFTLVISTLRDSECPRFFCYFLNAIPGRVYFEMEGWGTAQTNISVPIVQYLPMARPTPAEQRAIADYLDCEAATIDRMIVSVEVALERLQEYRTALITAAVTGKIDVRGAVA